MPPAAVFRAVLCQALVGTAAAEFAAGITRPALPPMGWRSWNWFACNVNQTIMEQQAAAMATAPSWASKSLLQLGYSHIGLDDCWQVRVRFGWLWSWFYRCGFWAPSCAL